MASIKAPIAKCVVVSRTTALIGKRKYGVNLAKMTRRPADLDRQQNRQQDRGRDKRGRRGSES